MKHLFFFYWIVSLVTGLAALSYLVILMIRDRTAKPLPYTILVSNFTLLILVNILASYHYTNINSSLVSLRVYLMALAVLMSLTICTAPYFLLSLYDVPHVNKWSLVFLVYAVIGAAAHVLFFGASWLIVYDASIPVLFLLLFFFIRGKKPAVPGMVPFLSAMKIVLLVYIPFYLLVDLNFLLDLELFAVYSDEYPLYFGVLPLFYMTWNALYLYFELRRGIFSEQKTSAGEDAESAILRARDMFGLSNRETEIFRCIIEGASRKEIAHRLFIAEGTVKKHIQNIFEKTGCHSRLELMALVFRGSEQVRF
jgi:DNA-binding CsgD family transcriptional regulator